MAEAERVSAGEGNYAATTAATNCSTTERPGSTGSRGAGCYTSRGSGAITRTSAPAPAAGSPTSSCASPPRRPGAGGCPVDRATAKAQSGGAIGPNRVNYRADSPEPAL